MYVQYVYCGFKILSTAKLSYCKIKENVTSAELLYFFVKISNLFVDIMIVRIVLHMHSYAYDEKQRHSAYSHIFTTQLAIY